MDKLQQSNVQFNNKTKQFVKRTYIVLMVEKGFQLKIYKNVV